MKFHPAVSVQKLLPGKSMQVNIDHYTIALFNDKGNIYAVQNNCPHQQGDLSDGYILNNKLYCPLHQWAFNLPDGTYAFNPEMRLKIYQTKIENDIIYIGLDK